MLLTASLAKRALCSRKVFGDIRGQGPDESQGYADGGGSSLDFGSKNCANNGGAHDANAFYAPPIVVLKKFDFPELPMTSYGLS